MPKRTFLLIPGPVDVDDEVLAAMGAPMTPHYGAEWAAEYHGVIGQLRQLYKTEGDVFPMIGSGTTALDTAIGNLFVAGQRLAVVVNGYFGERLVQIAAAHGIETVPIACAWGRAADPDVIRAALDAAGPLDGLALVHVETSTGVINPLREIVALAKARGLAVIVDAVTSLGGVELDMDAWGIDIAVSASQKSLAGPPGVGLIAVSKSAWERVDERPGPGPGWYLNLKTWRNYYYDEAYREFHPTPVTVPPNTIRAVAVRVRRILEMGLEAYQAQHVAASSRFRAGLPAIGLTLAVPVEEAAPMVSSVALPAGVDPAVILAEMRALGVIASSGFASDERKALRFGHMGRAVEAGHVDAGLAALGAVMRARR